MKSWLIAGLCLMLAGCAGQRQSIDYDFDPAFATVSLHRVAVLPPLNKSKISNATFVVGSALSDLFTQKSHYEIVSYQKTLGKLQERSLLDDVQRIQAGLEKTGAIDATLSARIGQALDVDAVLIPTITEFDQFMDRQMVSTYMPEYVLPTASHSGTTVMAPHSSSAEVPTTVVAIGVQLVDTRTGWILWATNKKRQWTGTGEFPSYSELAHSIAAELVEPFKRQGGQKMMTSVGSGSH